MKVLQDDTLAYRFEYPAATASGRPLPLVFSRKPERYSSAAPLTADARQRIVCELADLLDAVTVSVTVSAGLKLVAAKSCSVGAAPASGGDMGRAGPLCVLACAGASGRPGAALTLRLSQ